MGLRAAFASLLPPLRHAVMECYGANLVTLAVFGSVARGTPVPDSDVDLLIVCRQLPPGRGRRMAQFARVEAALAPHLEQLEKTGVHTVLSPVLKTVSEAEAGSHLYLDMIDEAVLLHDQDSFLASLLSHLRQTLVQLGARRVQQGSRWYWILKPDLRPGEVIELWPGAH